jgi:hypothetical protein
VAEIKNGGNIRDTEQDSRLKYLALWKEYEGVAMHFNELLIRLRTQALGGVAAISAITGFLSATKGTQTVSVLSSMRLLETVFLVLAVFWVALFCLDFFYYRVLLNGAVEAILDLEKETGINLSTKIDQRLGCWKWDSKNNFVVKIFKWLWWTAGQILFYVIVLGVLLWLYVRAGDLANRADRSAAENQAAAQAAKPPTPTVTPAKIGP